MTSKSFALLGLGVVALAAGCQQQDHSKHHHPPGEHDHRDHAATHHHRDHAATHDHSNHSTMPDSSATPAAQSYADAVRQIQARMT